ncbi:MAG: response regulator [Ignavibacteria bacterium RIFOXYB2_FULL_35_12]|nr:MAG: response regulator [Ignavibacteria bacterium GWA2_36_19]OGU54988.1 MAG: response regulator [Ignavibacteria bacterium GWC2_35_8]OGU62244.1 MAG: response regulator [Ignavibacteria bacterium GWF2_35_20]OGU79803.1 MAG: response regulator [Ignavibacteria bacterium RIFOXYA2_FULL_35_9]OGU84650.1 MAG: response regulator [Ignavibacteria bacterium RIFOXYA12_FULL_35_25]OGU96920.1 MAG: response regulator [Ignavibacteria bacterium RIFOXYB12_FULL_35_14]OGV00568.1 MAG: response regulator [Ignavibact
MIKQNRILWVDDEIELLRSHVIFLSEKGFIVDTVTNGEDAISSVKEKDYDLIFLDEMMAGMGGLETLAQIKDVDANIPVVMVTKNEEESLMNEAIGFKISDYLTKPVNPSQVLLVCKKILEGKKITGEFAAKDYLQDFNQISQAMLQNLNSDEWIEIYLKLVNWDLELDIHSGMGLRQTFTDQKREANKEFSKFVENNYRNWINSTSDYDKPTLTVDILNKYLVDQIKNHDNVFFFVLDCLRLDQWLVMEKHLTDYFKIDKSYYYSILPTSTPYARNSLFGGLYPSEIEKYYPQLWQSGDDDENSMNKYEKELLQLFLDRKRIKLKNDLKYIKIIDPEVGRNFEQNILSYQNTHLTAIVVNFLDMIAHGRSDSDILKEIAPDESAYRSLTNSWFTHSSLLSTFKSISSLKKSKIVITTDHGSIRALRGAKVLGDREASSNLRFKYGRNLKVDDKHAVYIKNADDYKLPKRGVTINYIIAKEDYYFVYPTEYHKYLTHYKDTFQHGGISLDEILLPVITMEPK